MTDVIDEVWVSIPDFEYYKVSSLGRIYNERFDHIMSVSYTNHGHAKITLLSPDLGERFTRSVANLVAEAFVEKPNSQCDEVILLDGDLSNVAAYNLAWRPRWYAWKYTHQMKTPQPRHYKNLGVMNVVTGERYSCVVEAGMAEGLLFELIWRSTYTRERLFPTGAAFEVTQRV